MFDRQPCLATIRTDPDPEHVRVAVETILANLPSQSWLDGAELPVKGRPKGEPVMRRRGKGKRLAG